MTDKEQIKIDGIQFNKFGDFYVDYDFNSKFQSISSSSKEYKILKSLIEQLARKTQECEKLEDFRTLTREVFTFGDSDVDDENFIKYLQEYSRSYEEAIDGYYRLTDITGIDYTVHGGADIEEIIKRVDILKHECEELKERLERIEEDLKYQCVDCMNVKSDRYRKALEEIEKVCLEDTRTFADGTQMRYDSLDDILNIISKAKGEGCNANSSIITIYENPELLEVKDD